MSFTAQRWRRFFRSTQGFTLVEIMIVVLIIGLLAALAIPAFARMRLGAQNNRVANDFRVFAQAFETYALQHGTWPPNASGGAIPAGMSGDFKAAVWQAPTSIGGRWNWDFGNLVTAGISIQNYTADEGQLLAIDAKIDDGNLSTGRFQQTSSNRVTFVLEQ